MAIVEDLIIKTNEIIVEYLESEVHHSVPMKLDKIRDIISRKTKLEISYHKKDWDNKRILGRLLRYEDSAMIETISGEVELNPCWLRFVRCKELCHLFLDDDTSYTSDPEELVHELVEVKLLGDGSSKAAVSEMVAILAAVELLFPMGIRGHFRDMIQNEGWSVYDVAKTLRIPEIYVERALSESYVNNIDSVHRKLINDGVVAH